jgi:hypothetical protein
MTYPIVEKLRRKAYRREIWHEPFGTMDALCDADDIGAEAYDANPDGPEAAEVIKELYEALDKAERIMSSAREELNRLRAQAKLPPMEPAALNVAVYEAKTALSRARGEEVGNG